MSRDKQILLFSISVFSLALFFVLPPNTAWLKERILPYASNIPYQQRHLGLEERKVLRWENAYRYSSSITGFFAARGIRDSVLVLLPPPRYFEARKMDYPVPEPAVFYYYTGLKTTWANSPHAQRANWTVRLDSGKLKMEPVRSATALADTIEVYRKIGYPL